MKNKLVCNGVLSPVMVSEELDDIFLKIERAYEVCSDFTSDYFGYNKEYIKEHPWFLMENYDKFRIFSNVATDYLYDAKMMLEKLMDRIGEVQETGNSQNRMSIEEIKIFPCFRATPPKPGKMQKKERFFQETGEFESKIILDNNNFLIDGYTSFLLALQHGIKYMPVMYGKRQVVKAYHKPGGKIYVWKLPEKLIDQVHPGEKLVVQTSKGVKCVTVESVEEYDPSKHPDPLQNAIGKRNDLNL